MSDPLDPAALRELVRAAIVEVLGEQAAPAPVTARPATRPTPEATEPDPVRRSPARRPLPPPLDPHAVDRIRRATPARVAQGRTGTRYLTDVYLGLRADHAIALDAVHSELPDDFAEQHGLTAVASRCETKDEFLLYPDHGRRLSDASRALLEREGDRGTDVQVVAGDGLSAYALVQNGPALVQALMRELPAAGFRVGKPIGARFARVGLQDDVGVLLGARATVIIVGERPGLGTGDSLSIYTAFGPRLNQDNSEKDCISNIRGLGLPPDEAARRCADLLRRTFAAGGGGIRLVQGRPS